MAIVILTFLPLAQSGSLADVRPLTKLERFGFMPLVVLAGLCLSWVGLRALRTKRIDSSVKETLLHGHTEYSGTKAVWIGISYVLGGLLLVGGAVTMMILGRTLLPE